MEANEITHLQAQLAAKEQIILNLKKVIDQKNELLTATTEKVRNLEEKKAEFEEALVNLTQDDIQIDEIDTFVSSNSRAAQLECEKNDFRLKLASLSSTVQDFCTQFKNKEADFDLEKSVKILEQSLDKEKVDSVVPEQQWQVRMELEHERRLRTQTALDASEKKQVALKRELDSKASQCQDLLKQLLDTKEKHQQTFKKVSDENRRLENLLKVKEAQICESEVKAKELSIRAEEFEELFNAQLSSVKALQADLSLASNENRALVKEMEMLNHMFNAMERQYVTQANRDYKKALSNAKDEEDNRETVVENVLKEMEEKQGQLNLEESCFREVTTKNGTRMVLSVSKTFMKLKDLIVEKKTLQDQVEKMKAINEHLCSRVNRHEEKLFNITDELNKTWNFVSTLKLQHRKLHESEQILRAELSEKRQLLAKLREELEYSRESWNVVKKKTADSEREWHALRAEFAARRKLFKSAYHLCNRGSEAGEDESSSDVSDEAIGLSSSESGFSTENPSSSDENSDLAKDEIEENQPSDLMTESTITIQNEPEMISVLIPPLDFLAEVPQEIFPPLLPKEEANYSDLYQKLMASSARSAALANRLAEMHRSISDDEDDYEPQTQEDSMGNATSPEIVSDIEENNNANDLEDIESDIESDDSEQLEDLGLSEDQIEEALGGRQFPDSDSEDEDTSISILGEESDPEAASELAKFQDISLEIPEPPPQPTFSLVPPPATVTVRPTYNYANMDSSGDSSDDEDSRRDSDSENATAVTRFLIKHLPKQLAKLRHDKSELEDKIRDLETLISNQNVAMSEMERRIDVYKKEAETARKWSASLANLHHIKGHCMVNSASNSSSKDEKPSKSYEMIELPICVTKGNVKMMWKILCSVPNTQGFVAYRKEHDSLATFIQSAIALHPNDYSEIEVKAQEPGLYVLQLRATRLSLSDVTYHFSIQDLTNA